MFNFSVDLKKNVDKRLLGVVGGGRELLVLKDEVSPPLSQHSKPPSACRYKLH